MAEQDDGELVEHWQRVVAAVHEYADRRGDPNPGSLAGIRYLLGHDLPDQVRADAQWLLEHYAHGSYEYVDLDPGAVQMYASAVDRFADAIRNLS